MAHDDTAGPHASDAREHPGGPTPDTQLTVLRNNLLGGFGPGADTDQIQAHTRDRPWADAAPSVFERARTSNVDGMITSDAAPPARRGPSPSRAAVAGFLLGVLLILRLRRPTW